MTLGELKAVIREFPSRWDSVPVYFTDTDTISPVRSMAYSQETSKSGCGQLSHVVIDHDHILLSSVLLSMKP
jgi:hypothetical protein